LAVVLEEQVLQANQVVAVAAAVLLVLTRRKLDRQNYQLDNIHDKHEAANLLQF
jgi:hypothetical protein